MLEYLKLTKEAYYYYCLFGMNIVIYAAAVIYFSASLKKEHKIVAEYGVITLLFLFLPITYAGCLKFWLGKDEVWKIYYLLQTTVILSYTMVEFMNAYSGRKKKWIVSAIFVIIMVAMLNYDMTFQNVRPLDNVYHVENQILELDQVIKNEELQNQKMIVPSEVLKQICEYDGELHLLGTIEQYSLDEVLETETSSYDILNKTFRELKEQGITCIILRSENNSETVMEQYGYMLVASTGEFFIYKR
ncbi:hypothetical protein [Roseburia inulinivorans]